MFNNIGVIIGTRPEAIKLVPVYLELKKYFPSVELVSTGQHASMLEQIFIFFDVSPDLALDVMMPNQTLAGLTARLCEGLQACYQERNYDLVIVQGDTTTAMTASLVAFYNRIKIAHVEAGLRTYHTFSPFPEEVNRQIVSRVADYHFAPTQRAMDVLEKEGINNCYLVGNTVIDSLMLCLQKLKVGDRRYKEKFKIVNDYSKLVLITGHRRENFGRGFEEICSAIKHLSTHYPDYLFYYPVHLNPDVNDKVFYYLNGLKNVMLNDPLPYDELIYLMRRSYIILTDSGGIQEEGPSLHVPILVMRDTTERPEGIESGCSLLVGTSSEKIISEFDNLVRNKNLYRKMSEAKNPYGDGRSSIYIAQILLKQKLKEHSGKEMLNQ